MLSPGTSGSVKRPVMDSPLSLYDEKSKGAESYMNLAKEVVGSGVNREDWEGKWGHSPEMKRISCKARWRSTNRRESFPTRISRRKEFPPEAWRLVNP